MIARTVLNAALSANVRATLFLVALIAIAGCHATRRGGGGAGSMAPPSQPTATAVGGHAPDERVVQGLVEVTGTAFENPPDVFRILIGARVWIQGALATGPYQYGVIRP